MKASIIFSTLTFVVSCITSVHVLAQTPAKMENVEIEIVKERKISLPDAERKFTKIAPHASEPISPPITYSFIPLEIQLPMANLAVRPLKLKKESDEQVKKGQFSAAYGNFASPYLEAYITSTRNPKQLVGAHALIDIWAKGPIDDRNSGNGKYGVSGFINSFGNKAKAGAYLSYDQSFWHFYGYPAGTSVEAREVLQHFNRFSLGGNLANASVDKFTYQLKGDFGYLTDKFDAKETKVEFDFTSAYSLEQAKSLKINSSYQLISRQDIAVDAKPRNLFQAEGLYSFSPIEKLTLDAGFAIAYENDTIDKDFHLYPSLFAAYELSKKVTAKASLTGSMKPVSMHILSLENPWLAPNVAIAHTNEAFLLNTSIEASVARSIRTEIGASVASLKNLYFYTNSQTDQAQFELHYDKGATERINFYTAINYALTQKALVTFRGDYYGYNTDTLTEAWHKPRYKVAIDGSYNFYKKLKVSSSFIGLGGMKAYEYTTSRVVTLDPAIDLSVRLDYFVSDKFLVFIQGTNLLSSDYSLYLNYPARGAQVRLGLSASF